MAIASYPGPTTTRCGESGIRKVWRRSCLNGHEDAVASVTYSPDGRHIVTGSFDKTVRIWDAESGTQLACLAGPEGSIWSVAFAPDGRWIASGSADCTVRIWDAKGRY